LFLQKKEETKDKREKIFIQSFAKSMTSFVLVSGFDLSETIDLI